ncbi:MAG TPA: hypothetical protein V6D27_01120 [Vampirovibrionales bacterium]
MSPQEIAEVDRLLIQKTDQWFDDLCASFSPDHPAFENIQARRRLIGDCAASKSRRAAEYARCKKDIVHWLTYWVWTYDPRLVPEPTTLPFVPWPHQIAYLRWRDERIKNKESGLIEKSRDSGLSWLNVAHQLHRWLFYPGWTGCLASRKAIFVDNLGDPQSLFEKARIILRYLPKWMVPKHGDGYLKLINLENGSVITGETGDEIGRGGRSSAMDIDEAAYLERAERVDAAVSQNTLTVFWTSTPKGKANLFAKKRHGGKIAVFRFHWRKDPRKDEAWYAKEKARLDPVVLAQEVDIDYDASDPDSFILPAWIAAAERLEVPERYCSKVAGLDIGLSGDRTVLIVRQGPNVISCISWKGYDTTQTAFKALEVMEAHGVRHLVFDADGIGAGVAGTLSSIDDLPITFLPLHGAGKPSNLYWPGERKRSHEKFVNRRAEIWGVVRDRIHKAYNLLEDLQESDIDDAMTFDPDLDHKLTILAQLSLPRERRTPSGKIQLEAKADMAKRGIDSPDFADALCYAFAFNPPEDSGSEPTVLGSRAVTSVLRSYY